MSKFSVTVPIPPSLDRFYGSIDRALSDVGLEYLKNLNLHIDQNSDFLDTLLIGSGSFGIKLELLANPFDSMVRLGQMSCVLIDSLKRISIIPPNIEIYEQVLKIGDVQRGMVKVSISNSKIMPNDLIQNL